VEAILFAEEEEDRRKGYTDCLTETHLDSAEYPYPAYLAKLSALFTEQSAFGKNPEDFIYCNNLLVRSLCASKWAWGVIDGMVLLLLQVSPGHLKLVDERSAALERAKLAQVRKEAALKAKEDAKRRRHERWVRLYGLGILRADANPVARLQAGGSTGAA